MTVVSMPAGARSCSVNLNGPDSPLPPEWWSPAPMRDEQCGLVTSCPDAPRPERWCASSARGVPRCPAPSCGGGASSARCKSASLPDRKDTSCMPAAVDLRRGLAGAAGVLYAALASLTRPLTGAAAAAVAVPAAIVLTQACRRRAPGPAGAVSARIRRTAVAWGVVVLLAGALELAALSRQPAAGSRRTTSRRPTTPRSRCSSTR